MLTLLYTLSMLADTVRERLNDRERGATAVEYGLLVALIAVVIITVVATLGKTLENVFGLTSNSLNNATSG